MKINNSNIQALYLNSYKYNDISVKGAKASDGIKSIKDTCELSSVGKELNKLAIEDEQYGVSEEKLNEIRNQIKNNTYTVDSTVLAKAMVMKMKGGQ